MLEGKRADDLLGRVPGGEQRPASILLARLGLDELEDVGMRGVEHDHLRAPSRPAPARIVAAHASVARMNDTGPLARPPRDTASREERTGERLIPAPPPC